MRFAHLTDLHLPIPAPVRPGDLVNKRILGYLSWRRNRRFRHVLAALDAIAADCRAAGPDFTAISGDLVNISLPEEFASSIQWLGENFDPAVCALTLGNHDAYVATAWSGGAGRLASFMLGERAGEAGQRPPTGPDDFPFTRILDKVAFVFANSSPPTLPGLATGRLGAGQIARIGAELEQLKAAGLCRVLVLHHPVTPGATARRKALDDAGELRATLRDKGVELVLHGHTHHSIWAAVETPDGPRPVVGGASASHPCAHGKYRPARYNLFTIDGDAAEGWRIDVEVRELDPDSGEVKAAERRKLLPAP